jgi:rod shape-determining protein MreD
VKSLLFYLTTLFLILWAQIGGNYFAGTAGMSVNVILMVVLYFGLTRGPIPGVFLGFVWGLLIDASSLGLIGLNALLYAAAGYFSGMLRRQLDEDKVWTQTIFSLAISILYVGLNFILERLFAPATHPFSGSVLAQPFINAVVAPVLFWLMQRWSQLWSYLPAEE